MKNNGLFSSLFIEDLKESIALNDAALGRMATLTQTWRARNAGDTEALWESFLKQALGYLEFVPPGHPAAPGVYPLYEDWSFAKCISVFYLAPPGSYIDDTSVGRFYPAKLLAALKERKLNWGILTDGSHWRLYSIKSSRPYEDYVELPLAETLEGSDEAEYGLFERFFHRDAFVNDEGGMMNDEFGKKKDSTFIIQNSKLDFFREESERILTEKVKEPFLAQVDEVLQYICNGFIFDTQKSGEEYTEEERAEIFESAVKLIYRCLFLFYAEARRLLPTDPEKADLYRRYSIQALCREAHDFRWGKRRDTDQYDLWKHLKGLINAVNDGDPEYGIMGYNGGLFDDEQERFLGQHQLRNDFLSRALYLLAFVEPYSNESEDEYPIPYEDLEVRHLGELYETILEYTVQLADADRIRRRTKKGVEILMASQTTKKTGDTLIKKGEVYFGESALERKQTGSYYTPESLVRFLNYKTIVQPLCETFESNYRQRFSALLERAKSGHDTGTRRGAAQSAAALVERYTEEELFHFKVCDPAMGSGHFLVDAINQMTGLIIDLFAEIPTEEMMNEEGGRMNKDAIHPSSFILHHSLNDWRRRITRHCIYGVDLNPLAVNLAKLSLWLNCFATHHRLTFLDHHVRCGNSLIGIRSLNQLATIPERKKESQKKKDLQRLLFDYNDLSDVLAEAAKGVASITKIDEDDTDTQKAILDKALEATSGLRPLADLYTAYLMDPDIPAGDYKEIFERLAKGKSVTDTLNTALPETLESVEVYRDRHHFYHWPLEFPDVFPDENSSFIIPHSEFSRGFAATIGNPPWDIVKPNSQEFFSDYDPRFRSYDKQNANRISTKLMVDNPVVAEKWEQYCDGFAEQSSYFKEPFSYTTLGKGDINTFKLFLERFFTVLSDGGRMGIVVPSGIYTDQGCQPLREQFFNRSVIEFLYCFENRRAVFNIHRSFKFVLFGTQKGGSTDRFKCAFMEHDPERLPVIDKNAMLLSTQDVKRFSGEALSLPEFNDTISFSIGLQILGDNALLGDESGIRIEDGIHKTNDSAIFCTDRENSWPVYQGGQIWFFDHQFSDVELWVALSDAKEYARKEIVSASKSRQHLFCRPSYSFIPETTWSDEPRLVFREVAASTNERTFIFAMIPSHSLHTYSLRSLERFYLSGNNTKSIEHKEVLSLRDLMVYLATLNSFVIDFYMRAQCTNHLSTIYMYTPVTQAVFSNPYGKALASRALRLTCNTADFLDLWNSIFIKEYRDPTFWYPPYASINTYGPAHEREIRLRLRDEAENLTPKWGPHCGVHDRLPDRRDTGDRAQFRTE